MKLEASRHVREKWFLLFAFATKILLPGLFLPETILYKIESVNHSVC